MVPNNLIITLFIVNCIDCRSAAFVGQTSVSYNKTGKHFVLIKATTSHVKPATNPKSHIAEMAHARSYSTRTFCGINGAQESEIDGRPNAKRNRQRSDIGRMHRRAQATGRFVLMLYSTSGAAQNRPRFRSEGRRRKRRIEPFFHADHERRQYVRVRPPLQTSSLQRIYRAFNPLLLSGVRSTPLYCERRSGQLSRSAAV